MYNLLVSANDESWNGDPWVTDTSRCVREYTDNAITIKYGDLTPDNLDEMRRYPCIFAYEAACKKDPLFGVIRNVVSRQNESRVDYDIIALDPFITANDLEELAFELDIGKWEMNRTHWAVKDVDLARELHAKGVVLPHWARTTAKAVDITTHQFKVGLSFPGEVRDYVENVAIELDLKQACVVLGMWRSEPRSGDRSAVLPRNVRVLSGGMTAAFRGWAWRRYRSIRTSASWESWGQCRSGRETHSWTRNRVSTEGVHVSSR